MHRLRQRRSACAYATSSGTCRYRLRRRTVRLRVASPDVTVSIGDEQRAKASSPSQPISVAPEDLQLVAGELSPVRRGISDSSDVFRCVGCTNVECQGSLGCHETAWRFDQIGYLRAILTARVYDVATETPLELAQQLSEKMKNALYLKREDLQPVFSFKLRGAFNKMSSLSEEALARGVICSSAGNHAQGVALAARKLGTSAVICMPDNTPDIKVAAVRKLGAEVRIVGESYTETQTYAQTAAREEGRTFVAPYDDPEVIAGQGTIGVEIVKQLGTQIDDVDAIFVAIGGGGLIAGIASYVKALKPQVKIIGVEPSGANCMAQSLQHGERVTLSRVDVFADGVAVKSVGAETFRLCQMHLDGVVLVDNAQISAAIKDVFSETRSILEPAGAVAVAGAKAYVKHHGIEGRTFVAVTSGANMNFDRLRVVADLANYGLQLEAMLTVSIPEKPGQFMRFINQLYDDDGAVNVTEFKYRYSASSDAKILLSISVKDRQALGKVMQRLRESDIDCRDVTDVSLAQSHLRHLVGGRPRSFSGCIEDEQMIQVSFPERRGALKQFLNCFVTEGFNFTMFHYRSTGNRQSSALVGIQVPSRLHDTYQAAKDHLAPLDFSFQELAQSERDLFDEFIS